MKHFIDWYETDGRLVCQELEPGRFVLNERGLQPAAASSSNAAAVDEVLIFWQSVDNKWGMRTIAGAPGAVVMGTDNRVETPLRQGATGELFHLMELRTGNRWYRYRRVPDFPVCQGRAARSVGFDSLGGKPLIIGRKSPSSPHAGVANSHLRLELDSEALKISRELVEISQRGEGMAARLLKPDSCTYLNDVTFGTKKLIYGDRLQVYDYDFEFAGDSLRQTDRWVGGNLRIRDLRVEVEDAGGTKEILKGISADIWSGEFIGILGGSGQGKSTFLNALCGINPATSGEVVIDGTSPGDDSSAQKVALALVPQEDIIHRELRVEESLVLSARLRLRLHAAEIHSLVDGVIERLQLQPHRQKRISDLSGGQRKRVSIATELLARPAVLFLDEPSSGLDPATELELMRLLSVLSRTGLTVVCTTHVLENAPLFRRICFIHGGRAIFFGPSGDAEKHFGSSLREVYSQLNPDGSDSLEREQAFRESKLARDQVMRFPPPPPVAAPAMKKPSRVGAWAALRLLLLRQWKILSSDRLNVVYLMAQAVLIGGLVGWVSSQPGLRMFLAIIATMWFGCSNAAPQIVAELPVFRRERLAGLGLHSYILSKFTFLVSVTALQALVLLVTITCAASFFHPLNIDRTKFGEALRHQRDVGSALEADAPHRAGDIKFGESLLYLLARNAGMELNILDSGTQRLQSLTETSDKSIEGRFDPGLPVWSVVISCLTLRLGALMMAALTGVALGLAVSSLARSNTQAVMWVPLILIPQILFGGYVVTVPEMTGRVRVLSAIVPSYHARQISDVSLIYGQRAPGVTNKTRIPLFLSNERNLVPDGSYQGSADDGQEIVLWHDGPPPREQTYTKTAPHNAAWQNLTVNAATTGQRRVVEKGGGRQEDSIDMRPDVEYPRYKLFRELAPAVRSVAVLAMWIAGCYFLITLSLRRRQSGR